MFPARFPAITLCCVLASLPAQDKPTPADQPAANATPAKPKVALVRPSGLYADLPSEGLDFAQLLLGAGGKQSSFFELLRRLDALAEDKQGGTVLFDLTRSLTLNGAQLREVERRLRKLRASGRKSVAYLENASSTQYQLAALCDTVCLAEMGTVDFKSLSLSVTFLKDALDLLGVRMDVVRCGDFKGAVEPFLLPEMSGHLREHYRAMLASMNADVVRRVAEARRLEPAAVQALQARRLLSGEEALKACLVDRLVPWDGGEKTLARLLDAEAVDVVDALSERQKGRELNFLALMNKLLSRSREKDVELAKPTLAVLHLAGAIEDGYKAAAGSMVSGPTVAAIDRLIADDRVKGVVARVNSPGGSATASEAIRRALERLAAKKPLVFSMGSVAGSGGYWITCVGRPILAEATTITGSIGVFGMKPDLGALLRRLGVREEIVALDEGPALDALDRSWSEEARARMQARVDDVYARFLDFAARSRRMPVAEVTAIAGGRVWSGEQAVARGLVDAIGGLDDALARVAKEAGLEGYETIHVPKPTSLMDSLVEDLFAARGSLLDAPTGLVLRRIGNLEALLAVLRDALESDAAARVWALMPLELRVE